MPRRMSQRAPSPFCLLTRRMGPVNLPLEYEICLCEALMRRLECRDPREKWLRERQDEIAAQFALLYHTHGKQAAYRWLISYITLTKAPRANARGCDPEVLCSHRKEAQKHLAPLVRDAQGKPRLWLNPAALVQATRERVEKLYIQLSTKPLLACACPGCPSFPLGLEAWLKAHVGKGLSESALVLRVLAHFHAMSPHGLRRVLREGERQLKAHPSEP